MKIAKNSVVQFHYTLSEGGQQIETSVGADPLAYLHGHGNVIKGIEAAMLDKQVDDEFSVTVEPKDGYGELNPDAQQRIPAKHLIGNQKWRAGMVAEVETEKGRRQVRIVKMGKFMVTVDFNHPLAGKTLTFDMKIISVREATEDEISHGHAHGVGGHQH